MDRERKERIKNYKDRNNEIMGERMIENDKERM